jgi:NAD(P)-dependent dehydrogenase (short-subunit alcohol dehydrogenase family)
MATPTPQPLHWSTDDLAGSCVIVTGGTRGVGLGIVEAFLGAGCTVIVGSRSTPDEESRPQVVGPDGEVRTASYLAVDVRDAEQAGWLVEAAMTEAGRVDLVINNAGGAPSADAATASPRFSTSIIHLNLLSALHVAQAANTVMQNQASGGQIINISSVSGLRPSPLTAAYGAAKAGLISLTESLAVEWAPKVRVNCISAGILDTGHADEHFGGDEGLARVAATVPLGRLGTPGDIAGLCMLLASPLSAYVTGANLVAHGGGEWPAFHGAANAQK